MFGFNNSKDNTAGQQQTNQTSTQPQHSSAVSVNGYSSPYLSNDSTPATSSQSNLNPAQDLKLPTEQPVQQPSQPQINSEMLNQAAAVNTPQNTETTPSVSSLNSSPIQVEQPVQIDTDMQNIPTVNSLPNTQPTKPSSPYLEPGSAGPLNPEKDLQAQKSTSDTVKTNGELDIKHFLDIVIEKNASDLHLTVGYPAMIRIDGKLENLGDVLTPEDVQKLINQTLSPNQKELLEVNKEVDLSYSHGDKGRFRVNAYNERGNLAAAYRLIPTKIKSIEELNLPKSLYGFTQLSQGLFLVTGPTGSGKSTTLAAMLQEINNNFSKHVITIEDPIEYVYPKSRALVDQRELGEDTHDWNIALRSILRQDPDVVLIGEMRDFETIQAAITTAETGHLVFATLHTNSAAQSIDRIIDVFPPHQQEQIRTQLAGSLKGILSQRLIPKQGGGREAATELMIVTPAIQNLIREGKTYQIDNIISTSYDIGMTTLERALVRMVREGKITIETAQEYAIRPEEVLKIMKSAS